jgi:hypothetical protein
MKKLFVLPLITIGFLTASGCSQGKLTVSDAQAVLENSSLLSKVKPIRVEAVSHANDSTEAIVRTAIGDSVYSFKLRKYDDGWRWEFAETKSGGWAAPDVVVGQLLEERRAKKVRDWADEHRSKYEWTIRAMNGYSEDLPRRPAMTMHEGWLAGRDWSVRAIKSSPRSEDEKKQALFKSNGSEHDAWGAEILSSFSDEKRAAVFISIGADGQRNTADDVICIAQGTREWDNEFNTTLWNYYKSWQVPEGLEDIAKPFATTKAEIRTSRIVPE